MIGQGYPLVARLIDRTEWLIIGWEEYAGTAGAVAVPWTAGLASERPAVVRASPALLDFANVDEWIVPGFERGHPSHVQQVEPE